MEMVMDMWRVNPGCCGIHKLDELQRERESGCVGYLVAAPADEDPFVTDGRFNVDAYDDASVGVFFDFTRDGFRAAHVALRCRLRQLGHVLCEGITFDPRCLDPLHLPV